MSKANVYILSGIAMLVIAVVFWPVVHADFVWDDWQSFHDKPWLTQGDQWKHAIFHGFNDWVYYFRPLVVALFTLQVRLFDSTPGPMHAVSLGIHLLDTALVGMLSWQCAQLSGATRESRTWITPLCMALYGLHAALIESVAWIGCQFDLVATMLMLAGLIANIRIQQRVTRAATLAIIFFLAACAKESAISFPFLVVIFDWALASPATKQAPSSRLRMVIQRNWFAYAGIFLAGCAYVVFRHWALGGLINGVGPEKTSLLAQVQEICFTYLQYWKIILWPIADLNPIHPFSIKQFEVWSVASWMTMALALGIFTGGLYTGIKHASPVGWIIVAVSASLLPVLHIIPGQFERSLYHERYATTAVAMACAMLPLLWRPLKISMPSTSMRHVLGLIFTSATFLWLAFCVVNVRLTLPMWSNDVRLWSWALAKNPHASQARGYLLLAYMKDKDFKNAMAFADSLLADPTPCFDCMTGITQMALANDDIPRATLALQRMKTSVFLEKDKSALQIYYSLVGQLLMHENKLDDAERMARAAIAANPEQSEKPKNLLAEIITRKKEQSSH